MITSFTTQPTASLTVLIVDLHKDSSFVVGSHQMCEVVLRLSLK